MTSRLAMAGIIAAGCLSPAPAAASGPGAPADKPLLARLEHSANAFMLAWRSHDLATLSDTLTDDFVFAGPRGVRTKPATLDALAHCDLAAFSLGDFEMHRLSASSVILVYTVHHDMTCRGHKILDMTLNTDAFAKRGGAWKIVVTSETPLQPR